MGEQEVVTGSLPGWSFLLRLMVPQVKGGADANWASSTGGGENPILFSRWGLPPSNMVPVCFPPVGSICIGKQRLAEDGQRGQAGGRSLQGLTPVLFLSRVPQRRRPGASGPRGLPARCPVAGESRCAVAGVTGQSATAWPRRARRVTRRCAWVSPLRHTGSGS